MRLQRCLGLLSLLVASASTVTADPPSVAYIFPAGGQRGTTVDVRVGGYNLHEAAAFSITGRGVTAPKQITRGKTVFFEGPVIPLPDSQRQESYPKDYDAKLTIAKDAPLGTRYWRVATSQGVTPAMRFVVGDLPEVVENEIDGAPVPTQVKLPVTVNGRIFPREDVDIWTFDANAGQTITCEVVAARIGSPLDSRIEVRDPDGRRIAENTDAVGSDSRLSFAARRSGRYAVHIHDVKFDGLQNYAYRLTITAGPHVTAVFPLGGRRGETVKLELAGANVPSQPVGVNLSRTPDRLYWQQIELQHGRTNRFLLELNELPEYVEPASNPVKLPAVLNGRISKPGEIDEWRFAAKKGTQIFFDLKAARLGSPLDSVLTVVDTTGKQLATADDIGNGQTDSRLSLSIPADGEYRIRVQDRLASRGGPRFAYRLQVSQNDPAGFRVTLAADAVTVDRGKSAKLKFNVERRGGFTGEIELKITGLPKGVTVAGTKIAKGKGNGQLTFKSDAAAVIGVSQLRIDATATINGKPVTRRAVREMSPGEPDIDELALCVAVPTPFKFAGVFETKYAPRGGTFTRHYKLERNGFTGPITIQPADVQIRHLQGVAGPTIVLPPGTTEFDYPVSLPPWMEIGRTSRTCIMAVGEVTEKDGTKHSVSYSSTAQNDQIIILVDPGRLSVQSKIRTLPLPRGKTIAMPISFARGNGLAGPVTVKLVVPRHIRGVAAKPVVVAAGETKGTLSVQFAESGCGPFNMPLTIRATLNKDGKSPFTAETYLSLVVNGKPTPMSYFPSRQ
jgi:hypothetical protein